MPSTRPSALIIGAGSSGLAVLKTLRDRGIDAHAIDVAAQVGGRWANKDPQAGPLAYRTLHSATSREALSYLDYPAPHHLPVFPSAALVAEYCEAYTRQFGLHEWITLGERAITAQRGPQGGWKVTTDRGERRADALIVATGTFGRPRDPEVEGLADFDGEVLHVHDYRGPEQFSGRSVVVVGVGTSAVDLACDAAEYADKAVHSMRRGSWFLPDILFGRPADRWKPPVLSWKARRAVLARASQAQLGSLTNYGIAHPGHGYGEVHPLRSGRLLAHLAHGRITTRPAIARVHSGEVEYVDGRREALDLLALCTGWHVDHGFLPAALRGDPEGDGPSLLMRTFHPSAPDLAFAGLVDAGMVAMPIAEAQGRLIADHLCGDYQLPEPAQRTMAIHEEEAVARERFPAARRVRLQVDPLDFLPALETERRAGRLRARAGGHRPPVQPGISARD